MWKNRTNLVSICRMDRYISFVILILTVYYSAKVVTGKLYIHVYQTYENPYWFTCIKSEKCLEDQHINVITVLHFTLHQHTYSLQRFVATTILRMSETLTLPLPSATNAYVCSYCLHMLHTHTILYGSTNTRIMHISTNSSKIMEYFQQKHKYINK